MNLSTALPSLRWTVADRMGQTLYFEASRYIDLQLELATVLLISPPEMLDTMAES